FQPTGMAYKFPRAVHQILQDGFDSPPTNPNPDGRSLSPLDGFLAQATQQVERHHGAEQHNLVHAKLN
ncbi:MAG: hypothetical protein JJU05_19005, partial [Verrucomicrobia bacterium]|nr:hypothetical protein [Verrucomicrobiota bacterium]